MEIERRQKGEYKKEKLTKRKAKMKERRTKTQAQR